MGRVSDYGGNAYGGRRSAPRNKTTTQSMRCDACGAVRYVTPRELGRAARPRCTQCGGMLLETQAEEKRHKAERRPFREKLGLGQAYRCRCCGENMGAFTPMSLVAHLRNPSRAKCLRYLVDEGYTMELAQTRRAPDDPLTIIYGTAYVDGHGSQWAVHGVSVTGQIVSGRRFHTKYQAEGWLAQVMQDFDRAMGQNTDPKE